MSAIHGLRFGSDPTVGSDGRDVDIDLGATVDLSVPIVFGKPDSRAFSLPAATSAAVEAGSFVGDVRRGGSCNCETHHLTPHADGTHTEGPGHLTAARSPVRMSEPMCVALLVRVTPRPLGDVADDVSGNHRHDDLVVDDVSVRDAIDAAVQASTVAPWLPAPRALIIATGSGAARRQARFSGQNPPYLTVDAAIAIRERGFMHLLVDLPSIDREDDGGLLAAHRAFFEVPIGLGADTATDTDTDTDTQPLPRTVTELIAVDDDVAVGLYALFLQVAPIEADAAPSRPVIAPLRLSPRPIAAGAPS
jgi:kynurenine formamidase